MEFNIENYPEIRKYCEGKQDITFWAQKESTVFYNDNAPDNWKAYPPAQLTNEGYAQVFSQSRNDARGTLMKLELLIHLDGGRIEYKKKDANFVTLKVEFET